MPKDSFVLLVLMLMASSLVGPACSSPDSEAELAIAEQPLVLESTARQPCRVSWELQRAALGRPPARLRYDDDDPAVERGRRLFADRSLHGLVTNGRACADCHMHSDALQLSPKSAKARFDALVACRDKFPDWDDPLFRALDADDFRSRGDDAHDFTNLTVNGLVRVSFALPDNFKLIDPLTDAPSTESEVDVWRSVPSVNNVRLTGPDGANSWPRGPNPAGGYQLDARRATLQEQALGALQTHAQAQQVPAHSLLDDLSIFQQTLFSSDRVRALSIALSGGQLPLPSVEPPLDGLEQNGKAVFIRACATCHGGPSQTSAEAPIFRYGDIVTSCPRPVDPVSPPRFVFKACPPSLARNVRTYEITLADGQKQRRSSSDPGRALLTGVVGVVGGPPPSNDWNVLDVPSLLGIQQTAPYFHNNSAVTLEEVLDHYAAFFTAIELTVPPGIVPDISSTDGIHFDRRFTPEERPALLAYLRKL